MYFTSSSEGGYITVMAEKDVRRKEVDVTPRVRLGIRFFYADGKDDFTRLEIFKIRKEGEEWKDDAHIGFSKFGSQHLKQVLELVNAIDFREASNGKIALADLKVEGVKSLLRAENLDDLIDIVRDSPELKGDIFAIGQKRSALERFEQMLTDNSSEGDWQKFFEENTWIFGYGMSYQFLHRVGPKFESTTTGSDFETPGKRADALAHTRAEVSQFVFIEIKKPDTQLLRVKEYRGGCWAVSDECAGAVAQVQKTVADFSHNRRRTEFKDAHGQRTGDEVYSIEPRSFLVIGNLAQLRGNDDKVTCFELFRRNTRNPEILTFDELLFRARFIVENLSEENG
jgi:hypothetical protein